MFLVSKLVFAFLGQKRKSSVNIMLLICVLYCDAGPGCLIRIVLKYRILIVIIQQIVTLSKYVYDAFDICHP